VAFVEQTDNDDIVIEDDESNASNGTPPTNRPSHARKKKEDGNGICGAHPFYLWCSHILILKNIN